MMQHTIPGIGLAVTSEPQHGYIVLCRPSGLVRAHSNEGRCEPPLPQHRQACVLLSTDIMSCMHLPSSAINRAAAPVQHLQASPQAVDSGRLRQAVVALVREGALGQFVFLDNGRRLRVSCQLAA
jgi:hypothetical protein